MQMRLMVLIVLTSIITIEGKGQTQVADALAIRKFYNETTNKLSMANDSSIKAYTTRMKFYLPDELKKKDELNSDAVITSYEANPFFAELFPTGRGQSTPNTTAALNPVSKILNTDVTKVADGIAKFLVQRTKEELSAAFFAGFKDDLNSEKYSDLRILFPQTARLLNLIDEKIYQFSAYLTDLREAFILDLNSLPSAALIIVNLPKYQNYFAAHPQMKAAFNASLFISDVLMKKDCLQHIGVAIDSLPVDRYFSLNSKFNFDSTVNGCLKTARLISASLKSTDTAGISLKAQRFWISADSMFMLINDPIAFKIYLGLLYQQAAKENILFASGKKLTDILKNSSSFIDTVRNSITSFYAELNAFEDYRRQYRKIELGLQNDSLKLYYYGLFNSSLTILESGLSLAGKWNPGFVAVVTDKIIPPIQDASEVYMFTSQKKYGPAVLSLVKLYKDVFKDADKAEMKVFDLTKLITHLSTYGTFISQVAKAETSDEVADIIAKTVLPTGSSYIKKHSIFNVALQAYTGLYGGQQRQATEKDFVTAAGVYAPLGIAASWGSKPITKNSKATHPSSFSVFMSVIDVGSLVSYRFSNANSTLANDISIRLNQILSPGLHLVYGLPKVPLSIGAGGNWSPLLTKVESDAIKVLNVDKRPFRWQAFLAVDIPFLNFYNKPR